WIEQYTWLAIQLINGVENILVLQAIILGKKVTAASLLGYRVAFEVPEFGKPRLNGVAFSNLIQIIEGQLVLGLDPRFCIGRIKVLQPTVRVGDLRAMIIVDHGSLMRCRIS